MESLTIGSMGLETLSQFHFIRPWLLSLLPVVWIVWLLLKRLGKSSQWQEHLPKAVIDALQVSPSSSSSKAQWAWLIAWSLISLAAAGPSWLKQAAPVVQNQNATVIVLDLSPSMLAKDLTPDRLTLAKYKLIDVLRLGSGTPTADGKSTLSADGQFALVAYSGDAYTVSPLTDDPKTIEALLPALHPNVMPSVGSNVEAAMSLADSLLSDAGIVAGNILLITDGVAPSAFKTIKRNLAGRHTLSVLGIASNEAAPVPLNGGGFMRAANGEIILASLNARDLQRLATSLDGRFAQISANESDLNFLLNTQFDAGEQVSTDGLNDSSDNGSDNNTFDAWTDMGYLLLILILPIFLIFFRKGLVYSLPLLSMTLFMAPSDTYAASAWDKLWKNSDQRGAELIQEQNYEQAADTFKSKEWAAIAAYKNKDYAKTLEQLDGKTDANSLYNKANAQALNGDIDKAIESYQHVLELENDNADAQHNLALLEQLKKQNEQQQQQQSGDENSQENDSQSSDSKDGDSKNKESEQSESQQQGSEQQNSEQQQESQQAADESEQQAEQESEKPSGAEEPSDEEKNEQEASAAAETEDDQESDADQQSEAEAQRALGESPDPLKDSSEQWLRSIADDPSGLLRRKFEYQARQRQQQDRRTRQQNDQSGQQRY